MMPEPARAANEPAGQVKCVVWDLDRTLLRGVLLERDTDPAGNPASQPAGDQPRPADGMPDVLAELHRRGIMNSLASRNPPAVAAKAVDAVPWPCPFLSPQYGWGDKSDSLARIAAALDIGVDSLALVDDDPYERAEVAFRLPRVLVLAPDEIAGALDWPAFTPPVITEEASRRALAYQQRQHRHDAAGAFAGTRAEFRRYCRTTVTLWAAGEADLPRLHELSVRTRQFNSTGTSLSQSWLADVLGSATHDVLCVGLRDRFGDDGMVGGVVVETGRPDWAVRPLMMSCRAMGRGVIETLLSALASTAAERGARRLAVPLLVNERNVPLRIALVAAGFRAEGRHGERDEPVFARAVDGRLPSPPDWITVEDNR